MRIPSGSYGSVSGAYRRLRLNRAALDAEFDVPEGRIGQVIRQLRRRGGIAARRAYLILILLIIVIFVGLAFYLGLPFWQQFAEGRTQTLDQQIAQLDEELMRLDADRDALSLDIAAALLGMVDRVMPAERSLSYLPAMRGDVVIVSSPDGLVRRSVDGGQTFADVELPAGATNALGPAIWIGATVLIPVAAPYVLRSSDQGETFSIVPVPVASSDFRRPLWLHAFGQAGFLTDYYGGVYRTADQGLTFEQVIAGDPAEFGRARPFPWHGDIYLRTSDDSLLRSEDMGRSFTPLYKDGIPIERVFQTDPALFLRRDDGTMLRLLKDQKTPTPLSFTLETNRARKPLFTGETLLWESGRGEISVSTDLGDTFQVVVGENSLGEIGQDLRQIGPTVFAVDFVGVVRRSTDGGQSFEQVLDIESGGASVTGPIQVGNSLLIVSENTKMFRSIDLGQSWTEVVDLPPHASLYDIQLVGETVYVTENDGGLLRSTDGGDTFHRLRDARSSEQLMFMAPAGDRLFLRQRRNGLFHVTDAWANALNALSLPPGPIGDQALQDFLTETLPPDIANQSRLDPFAARLNDLIVTRTGLTQVRETTVETRTLYDEMPYALLQRQEALISYQNYIATCRTGAVAANLAEIAKTCEDSWRAREAANTGAWWQVIAAQVPPGILLLFLLATLSALYRYNMRLAGFHHSRADALELWAAGHIADKSADDFGKLATALGADMVAFGKTSVDWGGGNITLESLNRTRGGT